MFFRILFIVFIGLPSSLLAGEPRVLSTLADHQNALDSAINLAENELIIVSPFISNNALSADKLCIKLKKIITEKGVKVTVITDSKLDLKDGHLKNLEQERKRCVRKKLSRA